MELRNGRIVGLNGPLPIERRPLFEEGAAAVFTTWTALALAVENAWGGHDSVDKANALIQDAVEWFYGRKEYFADELEAELEAAIAADFNVDCEDGSPRDVASTLIALHNELLAAPAGGAAAAGPLLTRLRARAAAGAAGAAASKRLVVDNDGAELSDNGEGDSSDDGDDGDEDMDEDGGGAAPAAVAFGGGQQQQHHHARPEPIIDEDGFQTVQGRRRR